MATTRCASSRTTVPSPRLRGDLDGRQERALILDKRRERGSVPRRASRRDAWNTQSNFRSFTERIITTEANIPRSVCAEDVDGSGTVDVLSASYVGNRIALYANDGAQSFTEHDISPGKTSEPQSVVAKDVNGDGATDVVVCADDVSLTRSYDASGQLVEIRLV